MAAEAEDVPKGAATQAMLFHRRGAATQQMPARRRAPVAAISEGEKIRPKSLESEIEFVVKEPGDSGIHVFAFEYLGQVLIMFS